VRIATAGKIVKVTLPEGPRDVEEEKSWRLFDSGVFSEI
jgi:hypothetical protein